VLVISAPCLQIFFAVPKEQASTVILQDWPEPWERQLQGEEMKQAIEAQA